MIEFGGIIYTLDLTALEKTIALSGSKPNDLVIISEKKQVLDDDNKVVATELIESTNERGREIDATKYEIIRLMLEVLMDNNEESDTALGVDRALDKTPLSYKIAFNTLLKYNILKAKEL